MVPATICVSLKWWLNQQQNVVQPTKHRDLTNKKIGDLINQNWDFTNQNVDFTNQNWDFSFIKKTIQPYSTTGGLHHFCKTW